MQQLRILLKLSTHFRNLEWSIIKLDMVDNSYRSINGRYVLAMLSLIGTCPHCDVKGHTQGCMQKFCEGVGELGVLKRGGHIRKQRLGEHWKTMLRN